MRNPKTKKKPTSNKAATKGGTKKPASKGKTKEGPPRATAARGRAASATRLPVHAAGGRKAPLMPLSPLLPVEPRPEDAAIKKLATAAWDAALDKKCLEPVLLDVRALASYADYILVVSGRSDRQVGSIADGITDALRQKGKRPLSTEGTRDGQWTLIDFGDLIVHVFYHPVREFYDLEGLWSDAPRLPLVVPPEARAQVDDHYAL